MEFNDEELNIVRDALEDSLHKVTHSTSKVQTTQRYRRIMRRTLERFESALFIKTKNLQVKNKG